MRIDIATLFTQMCGSVLNESIVGRGIRNGRCPSCPMKR